MSVLCLIFIAQVAMIQFVDCQFSGGGGPSTFGYDASSACSKPFSRNGKSHEKLPCDFRRQSWCTVAGNTYPWHAVKRFVQENQGLMRRMYGDEKHINVLKTELDKNDIEGEYEDKYHRFFGDSRSFNFKQDEYEYQEEEEENNDDSNENEPREYQPNKLANLQEYTKPHFRPTTETTTTTVVLKKKKDKNSGEFNKTLDEKIQTSTPAVTLADIAIVKNSSFNEIPGLLGTLSPSDNSTTTTTTENINLTENWLESEETTVVLADGTARTPTTSRTIDRIDIDIEADKDEQQKFRPRPEYRPSEIKPATATASMQGQFFQDVAAKDPPVLKLRGVNACPVKEEVVAPFWANNTRGEVLALLNLPPFEQYVHWEKCTHENKQMYCRDGCRCEQQYRLHRLLAYDPNNECRGIFSDWFKFPSCCVCRCYDIELRVTSRSPRTHKKQFKSYGNRLK